MKPVNPQNLTQSLPTEVQKWAISIHKALVGGIALASPTSKDTSGVYNEFSQDNGNGVMIRIGANGTSEQQYVWAASNAGIVINHGLLRQPVGFHVVDIDKNATIYRTTTPDANQITLAPTDNTANATVYIF